MIILYPNDLDGKPLKSITIEVDTTLGLGVIYMADIIGTLNTTNYDLRGTTITVVALTGGTNPVIVATIGNDTIGDVSDVTLNTDGANVIFNAVSRTFWSATITN